jgi:hypothetical protein
VPDWLAQKVSEHRIKVPLDKFLHIISEAGRARYRTESRRNRKVMMVQV